MPANMESGKNSLYPVMHDIPQKRSIPFIWKVYLIITFQLFLTTVVVSVVVFVPPVANFFNNMPEPAEPYNILHKVAFFAFCSLLYYRKKHPLDYIFLLIFTVSMALFVGSNCAFIGGTLPGGKIIILKVVILTTAVVISSSLYIFWATKRSCDFISLDSFFFRVLVVLIFIGSIKIVLFPLEKLSYMICGCLGYIIIYGFIIISITKHLIERLSYARYIWVPAALYLHVINLFHSLLFMFCVLKLIKDGVLDWDFKL